MKPEIAKAALAFMKRVNLTGEEVPAYSAVVTALAAFAEPKKEDVEIIDKTKGKK